MLFYLSRLVVHRISFRSRRIGSYLTPAGQFVILAEASGCQLGLSWSPLTKPAAAGAGAGAGAGSQYSIPASASLASSSSSSSSSAAVAFSQQQGAMDVTGWMSQPGFAPGSTIAEELRVPGLVRLSLRYAARTIKGSELDRHEDAIRTAALQVAHARRNRPEPLDAVVVRVPAAAAAPMPAPPTGAAAVASKLARVKPQGDAPVGRTSASSSSSLAAAKAPPAKAAGVKGGKKL